jgi:hypothetical protein
MYVPTQYPTDSSTRNVGPDAMVILDESGFEIIANPND